MKPDGISNDLKRIRRAITLSLTTLFNVGPDQHNLPDCWKRANVTLIYKKKDQKTPKQTNGLLSAVSKVFEPILFNRLYQYC